MRISYADYIIAIQINLEVCARIKKPQDGNFSSYDVQFCKITWKINVRFTTQYIPFLRIKLTTLVECFLHSVEIAQCVETLVDFISRYD